MKKLRRRSGSVDGPREQPRQRRSKAIAVRNAFTVPLGSLSCTNGYSDYSGVMMSSIRKVTRGATIAQGLPAVIALFISALSSNTAAAPLKDLRRASIMEWFRARCHQAERDIATTAYLSVDDPSSSVSRLNSREQIHAYLDRLARKMLKHGNGIDTSHVRALSINGVRNNAPRYALLNDSRAEILPGMWPRDEDAEDLEALEDRMEKLQRQARIRIAQKLEIMRQANKVDAIDEFILARFRVGDSSQKIRAALKAEFGYDTSKSFPDVRINRIRDKLQEAGITAKELRLGGLSRNAGKRLGVVFPVIGLADTVLLLYSVWDAANGRQLQRSDFSEDPNSNKARLRSIARRGANRRAPVPEPPMHHDQ